MHGTVTDPIARLMDVSLGYCRAQGLSTIARLGIPDLLREGPVTASALARAAADRLN